MKYLMIIRVDSIDINLISSFTPSKGSEENQFAPFKFRGKQIDFLNDTILINIKVNKHQIFYFFFKLI